MGKPVAFDASAEERETRGFISMTTMRPSFGLTANCTLEPPVSTPISRRTMIEAVRMRWYSLSVSVSVGAAAHDFHLVLFPAEDRLFDENFIGRRRIEALLNDLEKFFAVIGNAAAR